jgi:phenylalanine-4-hydroxylase
MAVAPPAPTHRLVRLRGDYASADSRYCIPQRLEDYDDHDRAVWADLLQRQSVLATAAAPPAFLAGLGALELTPGEIPSLESAGERLHGLTGWRLVGVPGLLPEAAFFAHLAERRFPVTVWMRGRHEIDYLVEPDFFHDFFGHVPLLADPVFADFVQAYGRRGVELGSEGPTVLKALARLYWYTVEFGLIGTRAGLRAYGAGILSSAAETAYALRSARPARVPFALEQVLRTDYLIDDFQLRYFVLDSFEALFDAVLSPRFERACRDAARCPARAPGAAG